MTNEHSDSDAQHAPAEGDHGPTEESLGPIDWGMWASAVIGLIGALVMLLFFYAAIS